MPNQTPIFALPGLMEITRPELDRQRTRIRLPHKRLPDTNWGGIPSVGPVRPGGVQPSYILSLVEMRFVEAAPTAGSPTSYVLSSTPISGQGSIVIDNPTTWLFHVPVQPLPLPIGNYDWEIHTTGADGVKSVYYAGNQMITA